MTELGDFARRPDDCLSDLALDRLLVGEPGPRWEHVNCCIRCRGRLEKLKQASRVSESFILEGIRRTRRRLWTRRAGIATSLAVAATLLLVVTRVPSLPPSPDGERIKGPAGVSLGVYVRRGSGVVVAAQSPATVAPGEQIRFEVTLTRPGFLGIVGLDAAGAITPYVASGKRLRRLDVGRQLLDGSILLDDTLGAERLIAVLCKDDRPTREVIDAARAALDRAGRDAERVGTLPMSCDQATFLLQKTK
jgi:hypothetical protein